MRRTNIFSPELDQSQERDGFSWRAASVGQAIGGERIGATLYELPDGERNWPYHVHHGIEEWLVVVSGTPTLRASDGERVLRRGDVACFPVGPDGAHQLRGPGTVLIFSANAKLEITEYPDSGKVGVSKVGRLFRVDDAVDYWEGE